MERWKREASLPTGQGNCKFRHCILVAHHMCSFTLTPTLGRFTALDLIRKNRKVSLLGNFKTAAYSCHLVSLCLTYRFVSSTSFFCLLKQNAKERACWLECMIPICNFLLPLSIVTFLIRLAVEGTWIQFSRYFNLKIPRAVWWLFHCEHTMTGWLHLYD